MSSGKKSIQVAIKVRPLLKKEKDKEQQSLWRVVDNSIQPTDSQGDPIYFDHIFDQDATNQVIFDKVGKPIVHSAIEGFNGTIFAYGQTSSGKTYTMMGDDENPGVMVLAAKEIFRQIELTTERQFLLRIGYIEIYNEKIYDLLDKKNQDLKIHDTVNGLVSVNCVEFIITCEEDFFLRLTEGTKERTVGETNMNERSSRSHAIFRIIIESRKMDRSEDDSVTQSVLNLVDLAGSERADQTGARGTRLKEGGHINKSLLFLSNVIKRLSEDEDQYISYRDTKLTRILQASLGGNALTAIICTIKPTSVEESQSTLNFALRAKTIKTKPQVNETVSDATMMKRLEREIQILKTRLEEEQRKNESQIQVHMLEQLIRKEDLKIISCNSLHSVRNREKRRRTWCPSSTNHDSSSSQLASALPVPSLMAPPSRLQPPKSSNYHTPLITMKPTEPQAAPKSQGGLPIPEGPLPEIDEEFAPADMANFEMLSPLRTPIHRSKSQYRISITPKVTQNEKKNLEVVENELMELQEFTNLENKADIQHNTDWALKQTVESLTNRNAVLEKERLKYLEVKNEIHFTSDRLNKHEKRCDELQIQVTKLSCSNKVANEKIEKYEHELAELKKTNEKLEMEKREAVNLEFEFESHKNKSKLRENELLELLNDKQLELNKLEKSLKLITDEQLQNTKGELLQLSLSDSKADANGKVCVKCEDLQRILEENRKVTQEFEKLTLEFQQLKLNFKELEKENENSIAKVVELEELQKSESVECEKLHRELQELKEKLYDIQKEYAQVNLENSLKTEECLALNHQVELARQEMVVLQDKYNVLELSWQKQQQTLKDIESQYAEIECKYHHLQTEYKQLECCKGESVIDCERLQKDNVELQTQIDDLKHRVQDVQHQLLENAEKAESYHVASSKVNEETSNVQKQNEQLKQQLSELQTQFEDLQKEYDDLSNQLMDNLQESEMLKVQNTKLEINLKEFEDKCAEVSKAETEMCDLKSQLEKLLSSERKSLLYTPSPCRNSSMRSSGVCIEEEEFDGSNDSDDLLKKFYQLSECLTQIELEHQNGKRRLFKTPTTAPTPNYKLYLRNISGVSKTQKDFVDEMEKIHLQGSFKQHSFHIVELNQSTESDVEKSSEKHCIEVETNDCVKCSEYIDELKEKICRLNDLNEQERQSSKSLLENTERTLSEMREQITQLSAELLEKSTFVENCACKKYQKQIECLEKEKANMTLVCGELQEMMTSYTLDGSMVNCTLNGDMKVEKNDLITELDLLRSKESESQETIESQTKMVEYLTQKTQDLESDLKAVQCALEIQEQNHKEKCNQMQLEMLGELEISANKHRDNMKKYNSDWEERKVSYECTIKDLENQLKVLREETEKRCQRDGNNTREIQEQLDMVREEFNQLQTAHLGLQQSMPNQIKNELTSNQTSTELEKLKEEFDRLQTLYSQLQDDQNQKYEKLSTDVEDLKQKETQLLKEKEELYSELVELRVDYKTINEKYNSLVLEKELLSEEKENLHHKLCDLQEVLKSHEALQERIDNLVLEKEQIKMERKQIEQKLQSAESQIEEYCTEDATREEMIKSLQSQVSSIACLEEEKVILNGYLEKAQTELSNMSIQLEKLQEKQILEKRISDIVCESAETRKEEAEMQPETIKDEKQALEEKAKQYEMLHDQKILLEEQLKSFATIVDEKRILEQKLKDLVSLQEVNCALEGQITILKGVHEENSNLETKLKEIDTVCQEHVKALSSLSKEKRLIEELLNDEKKASDEKLMEYDTIKQEKYDIEQNLKEKLRELDVVKQEKIAIEEQLKKMAIDLDVLRQESTSQETQVLQKAVENEKLIAALASLNEEKRLLEEVLNDEKKATKLKLKENNATKQEKIDIEQRLQEKLEELDVVKQEKIEIEERLNEKATDLDVLRHETAHLEAQLLTKAEENDKQTTALAILNEEKLLLVEVLKDERKASEEQQKKHDDIKKEKYDIEEQLQEKLKELDLVKQERIAVEVQVNEKATELNVLRQETANLEAQLLHKTVENDKQTAEIADLYEKMSSVQKHVQQSLQTLNDFKNKEIMSLKENESLKETITTLTNSSASLELEKCNLDKLLQQRNEELQLLRNKHETFENQLTHLTEENKTLFEQCSQLTEEKSALEEQLKCLGEKEKVEELLNQMISEKTELSHSLRLANEKLESKQQELDKVTHDCDKSIRDVEMLKCSLLSSSREKQQLEEQLSQYQQLSEEKSKVETALSNLKSLQADTLKSLQQEKDSVQKTVAKYEHEISVYKQKGDTLSHKIESLSQQLHEMRAKANAYENLLVDHEELENALSTASKENVELSNEITKLKSSISSSSQAQEKIVHSQTNKIQKLESQLLQSTRQEEELRLKYKDIQEQLKRQQSSLQQQSHEFKASLAELQLKYDSLQATNIELQMQNRILEQQVQKTSEELKAAKSLQDELSGLKVKYDDIQRKMEATVDEAGHCSQALREELQRKNQLLDNHLESYNTLQREMNTKVSSFELDKEKLTSTIKTLQVEKSSLEEKIREITVNNFKQDLHKQTTDISANSSIDTSTSSSSPRSRKSIESINISVEDKLCTNHARGTQHTADRKNRRLSSFNERRQSYWGVTHDKETMTAPVDTSCNCVELDQKLQECEKKLFIRESQVTVLNMELKNHPLKEQNAVLMKRLQEEQDKYRIEIKRYKQRLYEQTTKTEKGLAEIAELKSSKAASTSTSTAPLTPPIVVENAETQTDCDLSASLSTLQGKYKDLINICRYRKSVIEELEGRLTQKENSDGNSMSAHDAVQMKMLESQYESMKKELNLIKEKYRNAKIVLQMRRDEINKLRSQLGQS